MAADSSRKRKFFEEAQESFFILTFVRIYLRIRALQINWRQNTGSAVARSGHEDQLRVERLNDSIQMTVNKRECRARAPVSQHAVLDMVGVQGLAQKWVCLKIDHADRKIVAGRPKRVNLTHAFLVQGISLNRRACDSVSTQVVNGGTCSDH